MFYHMTAILLRIIVDVNLMTKSSAQEKQYERLLEEQRVIKSLLGRKQDGGPSDYDWRIRPRGTELSSAGPGASPVVVTVNMYLRTISKVDDVNMEYSLHFTFREEWIDERLKFESANLKHIVLAPGQQIWMPDTFFQNEKDGKKHDIDTPNVLLRVYNGTGGILYSVRMTLTLSCPMVLKNYPMDIQQCFVDFASYAYTTHDIEYVWKEHNPVQIKDGLYKSMPSFVLTGATTANCTSVTNTGAYSCLRTILKLKREFSYYLLQLYIPSFMLVAVSWVSFWLDKDSVPARVTLGVTTLLTMTTQASGVNANLPPVSYTKAIDVWIGVCLAFIFGALLEFALVNYAARRDMIEESRKRMAKRNSTSAGPVTAMPPGPTNFINKSVANNRTAPISPLSKPLSTPSEVFSPSGPLNYGSSASTATTATTHRGATVTYNEGSGGNDSALDARMSDLTAFNVIQNPHQRLQPVQSVLSNTYGGGGALPETDWQIEEATPLTQQPSIIRFKNMYKNKPFLTRVWHVKYRSTARRVDLISRIVFPISFMAFNVIYWAVYLTQYLNEKVVEA